MNQNEKGTSTNGVASTEDVNGQIHITTTNLRSENESSKINSKSEPVKDGETTNKIDTFDVELQRFHENMAELEKNLARVEKRQANWLLKGTFLDCSSLFCCVFLIKRLMVHIGNTLSLGH